MTILQISKIQIRRGQTSQTGIPQLSSGELGWSIDQQELYIGNGSVSEGAPAVGNTRVLTENDMFSIITSNVTGTSSISLVPITPVVGNPIELTINNLQTVNMSSTGTYTVLAYPLNPYTGTGYVSTAKSITLNYTLVKPASGIVRDGTLKVLVFNTSTYVTDSFAVNSSSNGSVTFSAGVTLPDTITVSCYNSGTSSTLMYNVTIRQ